jgi:hypothetical protein
LPAKKISILYIVGSDLGNSTVTHPNISGGINLDMLKYNAKRVTTVQGHYHVQKVGLLVNDNAAMGPSEHSGRNWTGGAVEARGGPNETNANIPFAKAITDLVNDGAEAIVVASDPYFTSQRQTLQPLLNKTNLPVCYPFSIYKPGATPNKSMLYGVDLSAQYQALGTLTKQVLSSISSTNQIPNVGVTTVVNMASYW